MLGTVSSSFGFGRRFAAIINPNVLPQITLNYRADSNTASYFGGSSPANNATVTNWTDQSGNGHNANQSGLNSIKPIWNSNIQNGLGALFFNGGQSLNINPVAYLQNLSGATVYLTAKPTVLSGSSILCSTDVGGFTIKYNGTNWQVGIASGTGTSTITSDTTKFRRFGLVYDGTQTGNANRLKMYYDGVQQTLTFGATTVGSTTSASPKYWYIGTDNTNYFTGYIGMMFIFTRTLSAAEIIQVDTFLKNTWGL